MGFGFITLGFFAAAFFVLLFSAIVGNTGTWNPIFGGSFEPGALTYLGALVALALAAFGGFLPALALGASRRRSLLASAVAVVAPPTALLWWESETLLVVALVLGPVLVASAGAWGAGIAGSGLTAMFAVSTTFLLAALLAFSASEGASFLLVVLPEWVVLPAVAGLFLPEGAVGG